MAYIAPLAGKDEESEANFELGKISAALLGPARPRKARQGADVQEGRRTKNQDTYHLTIYIRTHSLKQQT